MSFWKRGKQARSAADAGRVQKAKKTIKRSPPVAMEVKILALEALDSGLSAIEVGELVSVGPSTIHKWRKDYAEGGVQGLCRKASSIAIRKQCSVLEEKIVTHRREPAGTRPSPGRCEPAAGRRPAPGGSRFCP